MRIFDFLDNLFGKNQINPDPTVEEGLSALNRIRFVSDRGAFRETNRRMRFVNPLNFPGYEEKYNKAVKKTGLHDAVITGTTKIGGYKCVIAVMDNRFFMASMGEIVGEKITQAIELADKSGLPLVIYCASGGARMQEGMFSLMQMAKTSAAIEKFSRHGGFYVAVLTNPTTGGVTASFASLADVTLAEPGAMIGFAGPRVIEQTIGKKLPEGFQTAEYMKEHGYVDQIVGVKDQKKVLKNLLRIHAKKRGPVYVVRKMTIGNIVKVAKKVYSRVPMITK